MSTVRIDQSVKSAVKGQNPHAKGCYVKGDTVGVKASDGSITWLAQEAPFGWMSKRLSCSPEGATFVRF